MVASGLYLDLLGRTFFVLFILLFLVELGTTLGTRIDWFRIVVGRELDGVLLRASILGVVLFLFIVFIVLVFVHIVGDTLSWKMTTHIFIRLIHFDHLVLIIFPIFFFFFDFSLVRLIGVFLLHDGGGHPQKKLPRSANWTHIDIVFVAFLPFLEFLVPFLGEGVGGFGSWFSGHGCNLEATRGIVCFCEPRSKFLSAGW
ncbi:hypothetical protein BKA82DRAFT_4097932 [Pisolithus tinctorius]|nr:hypothetical protein BKA82DRAFT_4097932 [Pisolithus tinctorius]